MMRMSYQRCHCLAIFLRMMRIFDDETHCFLEFKSLATVVGHSQGMGNGERYIKGLANALRTLQMLPKALTALPMAHECLRKLTA